MSVYKAEQKPPKRKVKLKNNKAENALEVAVRIGEESVLKALRGYYDSSETSQNLIEAARARRISRVNSYMSAGAELEFMDENGCPSEKIACKFIYKILKTVIGCYHQGVIHRDIKPENILVNLDNLELTLIDFGGGSLVKRAIYTTGLSSWIPEGARLDVCLIRHVFDVFRSSGKRLTYAVLCEEKRMKIIKI